MIKRTLEISQQAVHLTVRQGQLLLLEPDARRSRRQDAANAVLASVPCEDIGLLLVEHASTTFSHAALTALLEHEAVVVICGRDHLPAGLMLPLSDHAHVVWRLHDQLAVKRPLRKRLWQQIVQAKIRAQAANLSARTSERGRLLAMARQVRSGDPSNVEAHAARLYWRAWLPEQHFCRDVEGGGLNGLLNYGYSVLRAAVARALVSAGLLPALGIHHANRSNPFCLADDLVEPLRPLVDARVRGIADRDAVDLTPETKSHLLRLLADPVQCAGLRGPLLVALHRYAASLVKCYAGQARQLQIPRSADAVTARRSAPIDGGAEASG